MRVSAFDYDGTIAEVGLSVDDVYSGTDYVEPYAFTINPGIGVHKLTAFALDDDGATNASKVCVAVSTTNITFDRILITSIPVTNAVQDAAYRYTITAAGAEGDPISFGKLIIPGWLSFDAGSGVLSGTPSHSDIGPHSVALRVSGAAGYVDQSFTITVAAATGYDAWAIAHGITGGPTDDDDGDGLDNLFEYSVSQRPIVFVSGDTFTYVYQRRADDPNLVFNLDNTTNLLSGSWTTNEIRVLGTNVTNGPYDEITNSIPATNSHRYIRLKITYP